MNSSEFYKLASMLAEIAYHIHDKEGVDEELREMLLELWREFDSYKHYI